VTSNEFSGHAENVVQAAAIHGGVHFHPTSRPFSTPRQLPSPPSSFVNRSAHIQALNSLIDPDRGDLGQAVARVVVSTVAGPPGVGKTALAVYWAHQVKDRFPDGELYVDMHGYSAGRSLDATDALDAFLRAVGVPAGEIPVDRDQRATLFRSMLAGKRVILIIDNASSSAQVRQLLPAAPSCCVVVTSRSSMQGLVAREGAMRVRLDTLSPEDSLRLLSDLIGSDRVAAERSAALRLVDICGSLPLTLRVVAERVVNRPRLTMADIVDELSSEQSRLDALASPEDDLSDTRAVLSWSYRALSTEQARVFRLLGLPTGRDITVPAAAALIGTTGAMAGRHLRALADVHLLQEVSANRFNMHDLITSYARERATADESVEDRTRALRRLFVWYLHTTDAGRLAILPHSAEVPLVPLNDIVAPDPFDNASDAMTWFTGERLNLRDAIRQAFHLGQYDITWKLAMASSSFFELQSYWADWEDNHRVGLSAALALGDPLGEASNTLLLADAAWRIGNTDDAIEKYERAAGLGGTLSIGWLAGYAHRGLGLIHQKHGDHPTAAREFTTALGVFQSAGPPRGEAMTLLSLAQSARTLGDLDTAHAVGMRALTIFEELDDPWSLAWGRLDFAKTLVAADRTEQAIQQLRQASDVFDVFKDHRSDATACELLGEQLLRAGDIPGTRESWARATRILTAFDDPHAADLQARLDRLGPDH
jgi:tetratricopeptide (TPR) repeat protein